MQNQNRDYPILPGIHLQPVTMVTHQMGQPQAFRGLIGPASVRSKTPPKRKQVPQKIPSQMLAMAQRPFRRRLQRQIRKTRLEPGPAATVPPYPNLIAATDRLLYQRNQTRRMPQAPIQRHKQNSPLPHLFNLTQGFLIQLLTAQNQKLIN
jgi:hypothetical protein